MSTARAPARDAVSSPPVVLMTPLAREALMDGMGQLARLLRPTLGPLARTVALASERPGVAPVVLDRAAMIARRIPQLGPPFADMGAMLLRHAVWRTVERAGDGGATTAVLTQALTQRAAAVVAAGGHPVALARGLERAADAARAELRRLAAPCDLPTQLAAVAGGVVREPRMARVIGEILDAVGPDGAVLCEDVYTGDTRHEYVDGLRWNEGCVSPYLLDGDATSAHLIEPRIFLTEYPLETAEQLLPVVEACARAGERNLLVIAPAYRDAALALLIVNRERGILDRALAVRAPGLGAQQAAILQDLAIVTGGRCLRPQAGDALAAVTLADLGRARRAWVTRTAFGLTGSRGDRAALLRRLAELRAEARATGDDRYTRQKLQERIGKLAGTTAVIYVGAPPHGAGRDDWRERLESGVAVARAALREGIVPGGGAAFLACAPAARAVGQAGDEAAGAAILAGALSEPMRAIAENAGVDPAPIIAEAGRQGPGRTFDVLRRQWVNAMLAGIVDPLPVTLAALDTAVSVASLALTTDVLVRRRRPPLALEP